MFPPTPSILPRNAASVHPCSNFTIAGEILVGAVGIENTAGRSFKNSVEMMGNAKTLKSHNKKNQGILIGPSMAPRFSSA